MTKKRQSTRMALIGAALFGLSACGGAEESAVESEAAVEPGTRTIAALIASADELSQIEALMEDGGLSQTFDGTAAYTVFAPTDAALEELGEEFTGEEARPALLAILRQHVVPGYLTADDIAAAVAGNGGPVEMQTMGEGTLTFAMEGDSVTVRASDAASGIVLDSELLGANGVVIPISGVLIAIDPET